MCVWYICWNSPKRLLIIYIPWSFWMSHTYVDYKKLLHQKKHMFWIQILGLYLFERVPAHWFISQMSTIASFSGAQSQEPAAQSLCRMWVAGPSAIAAHSPHGQVAGVSPVRGRPLCAQRLAAHVSGVNINLYSRSLEKGSEFLHKSLQWFLAQ